MEKSYSQKLGKFIEELSYRDLDQNVVEKAKECFLDWLGCAIAGIGQSPVEKIAKLARSYGGNPQATVISGGDRSSCILAALANGAASHVMEMDDVHRDSVVHAGSVIMPAVFSVAEREKANGSSLIEAVVSGYEVMIRVGESVGRSHYWFWHNTSTCGPFGAAAGVGKIIGLNAEQYVYSLGNAGSQAGGLWEFLTDGANTKLLHTGKASLNGIIASDLAYSDFSGARQIFEGEKGFLKATSNDFDAEKLVEGIDDTRSSLKIISNSFKLYPSCRHTHPPIDGILELVRKNNVAWEQVLKVDVYTYSGAINLCSNLKLKNEYVAKWNIPFVVATGLKYRSVDNKSFSEERLRDPDLLRLCERVYVKLDDELDSLYPKQWPARIIITLEGGKRYETLVSFPKGDPENMPERNDLIDKFRQNASQCLPSNYIEELLDKIEKLEEQRDISVLLKELKMNYK